MDGQVSGAEKKVVEFDAEDAETTALPDQEGNIRPEKFGSGLLSDERVVAKGVEWLGPVRLSWRCAPLHELRTGCKDGCKGGC